MKRKTRWPEKKLILNRNTVRQLGSNELESVQGGDSEANCTTQIVPKVAANTH